MRRVYLSSLFAAALTIVANASFAQVIGSLQCSGSALLGVPSQVLRVNLAAPAPAGGYLVTPASSDPGVIPTPAPFTIPAGATTAIVTATPIATGFVAITATVGSVPVSCPFLSVAAFGIVSMSCPTGLFAGGPAGTVTVTLNAPVPAGGTTATPDSADTAVATVPAPFTVPAGATTVTFNVTPVGAGTADIGVTIDGARMDCVTTVAAGGAAGVPTFSMAGLLALVGLMLVAGTLVIRRF